LTAADKSAQGRVDTSQVDFFYATTGDGHPAAPVEERSPLAHLVKQPNSPVDEYNPFWHL